MIHEERRFNYDLLAAAVFKGHISLVNTLASIHLKINAGTFGDPFEIAMLARNYDILAILFAIDAQKNILDDNWRFNLLKTAIKDTHSLMVRYILDSHCNPLKPASAYGRKRLIKERNTLLHTPDVVIFRMVL